MENRENLDKLRHSAAHLLAAAVLDLYPGAHNAIGPAIENGFYQDFDFGDRKITDEDLPKIEQKMRELMSKWDTFEIHEVTMDQAKKDFAHNPYKSELIEEFSKEGKTITETKQGDFLDLCKGGHLENPKDLKHFKLLSLAGAYWRGDEKNKMLTRIYGTAFPTKDELFKHLEMLEEAKKRDHKKLGRELDLFIFTETAPGMAYWLPKGFTLYNTLYEFARQMYKKHGYEEIATPQINKKELYETSGHWHHYREDMFLSPMSYIRGESQNILDGTEVFGIKPMNCPNAMTLFGIRTRSYHDLPIRWAETSTLHRFELSGTLNGLFRTRMFRQDDAHIFVQGLQIKEEFEKLMKMIEEIYSPFGLEYRLRFGTKPEKFMGDIETWKHAEEVLELVLKDSKKEYVTAEGEGAFYGPKVDILMKDSLGREWQTGTIQLDFQQPKQFKLEYADSDGTLKTPVVIHRALLGSFERFLGILIEHYAGKFPLWLAPVQIELLPISEKHTESAQNVAKTLQEKGIRVQVDSSNNTLQARIRQATLQKVPFMGIIGDREIENHSVSLRNLDGQQQEVLELDRLISKILERIDKKT